MINLSQQLAELSPQKRELLRQQLRYKRNGLAPSPILPRPDGTAVLPLSFAQQRLWFLDRLEPGSSVYNIPAGFRLHGPLDLAALEQSFTEIVRRHESLRTTFPTIEEQPVQSISPASPFQLTLLDLRQLAEVERELQVQHLAQAEAQRPFDLAQGPLFRAVLLQLNQNEHVLLLTMHHIISDGWSMSIFFRELSVLYAAFSTGKPSPLPELPIQYADFSLWQRQRLQGEALSNQLAYWKKQLQGAPPLLDLPTDRPRLAVSSHHGAGEAILLSKSVTEALKTLSQREGGTLFMTLLAAFQLLLYRYTGQNDLVIGTPIANRTRIESEGLIGFFINTLALRLRLSSQFTFQELLARVREVTLEAYAQQDLPFEKLVEELQPERDLSHTPLFQVWFVLQNAPAHALQLPGLTVTALAAAPETAKFDLTLSLEETHRGLQGILGYNTQLFEAATIERMARRFETLLQSIVAEPQQRLLNLRLLNKAEQDQLAAQASSARPTQPFVEFKKEEIEQPISARFARQVSLYPHHLAVKTSNYEWTYETLHRVTNQIARAILDLEGAEVGWAALLFEHDAPMIAGILGVLKAGKTYVPLDPAYPYERLAYILADSQASVILTNNKNQALAKELSQNTCRLINIDELDPATSPADIRLSVPPDAFAYILYTSGSTGQPKGVVQNQRNVLHHIRNYTNNLHINSGDRLTLLSSYGFDAAVMDIFGALLNGAALYPINIKEQSLTDLSRWLIEHKITIYHSTPAVYRYFFGSIPQNHSFPAIRLVVLGGEEVYPKDVALYKKQFGPDCILVNGLGPTESTVSFQYFINHQTEINGQTVPVGFPVEGTQVLLLDEAGEETVVYGEIAIRSPHVALGYWRRPDLTAAAFPADSSGNGNRIYRTGDMGRLRPDSKLEFVGRRDFQVKIRGFRIELREIETVLASHPEVRDALVVVRQDGLNEQQIVAYVVTRGNKVPDSHELRDFLKLKLPDYMIPAAFVTLAAFPLTPNGKINRQALPVPDLINQERDKGFIAPRDALETQLVKIWEAVLGRQGVSIKSNFFEIGGHSLLVVRVLAQIEKNTGP
ncbi:MAG: amino acid adenylation domain-containing protein [Anaerolineales bacterium]|nr:amino acid adenylation domain-containing protein [Anaerolineales bacterium]